MKRKIDLSTYPRRAHFEYFRSMANPFAGVTANVDVTELVRRCKSEGRSFYTAMIHVAAIAANAVPELRRRIIGGEIWEYDVCPTSHIELLEDGTYCYCTLMHDLNGDAYFEYAERERGAARQRAEINEDGDPDSMLFITCIPWIHYTALVQPTGNDSNPRISWGKYEMNEKGRLMLPVTILAHHGLADGINFGEFYNALAGRLSLHAVAAAPVHGGQGDRRETTFLRP